MFELFIQNNLIAPNQSGFKTSDLCINQLISITHDKDKSFDDGYEVRDVFLDIWHQGLQCKLKQNGISGKLLKNFRRFLDNRTLRVILNGQYSSWVKVGVGVRQSSVLGPLLFLIYINDLPENLGSNPKLFDDDTSLFSLVKNVDASNIDLNNDFKNISGWAFQWKMNFNTDPINQAQELIFSRKMQMINHPPLFFNQNVVPQSPFKKFRNVFR